MASEYQKLALEASQFAQMCADFARMGTGEFTRKYPDYNSSGNFEGVDYIARRAKALATKLNAYRDQVSA